MGISSLSEGIIPPVSMTSKGFPSHSAQAYRRSRVMPGSLPTSARRCLQRRLNKVDLPTLGRPRITMRGSEGIESLAPRQNLWVEVGALVRSKEKDSASCPDPVWVVLSQNPMQGGTGCS